MTKVIPLYTTRGEHSGYFTEGHIFNMRGEWIGFVDSVTNEVFSLEGEYVGQLTRRGRILRRRVLDDKPPRRTVPPQPVQPRLPATVPLPPMYAEVGYETIDVLEEMPEQLHTIDSGEFREDMD